MLDQDEIEEAIARIQDLGISRSKAVNALSRYNYDVSRAADYIFSGNALDSESDSEQEQGQHATNPREQQLTNEQRVDHDWEESSLQKSDIKNDNSSAESARDSYVSSNDPERGSSSRNVYNHSTSDLNDAMKYDPSQWSVVPFSQNNQNRGWDTPVIPKSTSYEEPSVTWWIDPEDPAERAAQDNIPLGLRPPSYTFPYAPIILQILYHIPAFQHAILSYRPSPDSWGSPLNYWKGNGEQIPPYMSKRSDNISIDVDLLEESTDDIWNQRHIQPDAMELEIVPTGARVALELQKLFAFLSLSKRRYGNVTQLTQMLKSNESGSQWNLQDMTVDAFLDKLINGLADAEKYADPTKLSSHSVFEDFFLLRALVQDGRDVKVEEISYLTLGTSRYMRSFHDCLGPMVYAGSDGIDFSVDSDQNSVASDASDEEPGVRLTTFEKVPPILMVTLENRAESDDGSYGNHDDNRYLIERTVHLGRYLQKNGDKALECYQKVDDLKRQIRELRNERAKLGCSNAENGIDKRDILEHTVAYFEGSSPKFTQSNGNADITHSLRSVLSGIKRAISRRYEELQRDEDRYLKEIQHAFDIPEFKEKPYDLRATLHHDGMSGTGHYWAYILVEPAERNLLEDIPNESGGWFKFCDACVERVADDEMLRDDMSPFALIYTDRDIPIFSKQQLQSAIPETLKEFVDRDNEDFQREIETYAKRPTFPKDPETVSLNDDDVSINFERNESSETLDGEYEYSEQQYEYTNSSFGKLGELVESKVETAQELSNDDSRLLRSFEMFLAKIKDKASLQHLYMLYNTNEDFDTEPCVNEQDAKHDERLKAIWTEYDAFRTLGLTATNALIFFSNEDYLQSLLCFAKLKQSETQWKEHLKLETRLAADYPVLENIGFDSLVKKYGRLCIKLSNERAYTKAINAAYRTRGLEDALRISQLVHVIIGPENLADDVLYSELRNKWLTFSESQGSSLEETQAELLNALMISYLEGQSGGPGKSYDENEGALWPIGKDEGIDKFYERAKLAADQHETKLANDCSSM